MAKKTKVAQLKEFREAVVNWENNLYQNGYNFESFMQKIPALQAITQQYEMCWKGEKEIEGLVHRIENSQEDLTKHIISLRNIEIMAYYLKDSLEKLIDEPRIKMINRVTKKVTEDPELLKEVDKFIRNYYSKN